MEKFELVDKNGNKPGKWGTCGGKVDMEETTIEAGVRENFEKLESLDNEGFEWLDDLKKII